MEKMAAVLRLSLLHSGDLTRLQNAQIWRLMNMIDLIGDAELEKSLQEKLSEAFRFLGLAESELGAARRMLLPYLLAPSGTTTISTKPTPQESSE